METEIIQEYITWTQVKYHTDIITESILKDNKKYDCIVSLGRGGMVLSRLLAENLNIREIHILNVYSYVDKKSDEIKMLPFNFELLKDKNVLFVDDVCTTGKTIVTLINCVEGKCNYDIATEYYNENLGFAPFKPTYYAKLYNGNNTWLVFPWESRT